MECPKQNGATWPGDGSALMLSLHARCSDSGQMR